MSMYWYNFGGNCQQESMDYTDFAARAAGGLWYVRGESAFDAVAGVSRVRLAASTALGPVLTSEIGKAAISPGIRRVCTALGPNPVCVGRGGLG